MHIFSIYNSLKSQKNQANSKKTFSTLFNAYKFQIVIQYLRILASF